jgi:hypothetical protein
VQIVRIDPVFRIDLIADHAERDVLRHVLIDTWLDESVAVVADGFTMAVVPVEMDEADRPGLLHMSVIARAYELAGVGGDDSISYPSEVRIRLGNSRAQLSDGSILPRHIGSTTRPFPDWRKVIPTCIADTDQSPVFGIQPQLLDLTAQAIGCRFVALHRANSTQILLAPQQLDSKLEPPFAVMMLSHIAGMESPTP